MGYRARISTSSWRITSLTDASHSCAESWLERQLIEDQSTDLSDLLELDTDPAKTLISRGNGNAQEHPEDDTGRNKKLIQSELIDKFILANPRIEPVKDPANVPSEAISKPFAEKEGGFVTETLARIYVNQGYYSKAIDIYKELSLKFPEKSSYFASQIELVKVYLKK